MEGPWCYDSVSWLKCSPIANDRVGLQISRYMLHYIPIDELIRQLAFIRPTYQYYFGTQRAIDLLVRID